MKRSPKARAPRQLAAPRPPETDDTDLEPGDQHDKLAGILAQFSGGTGYSVRVERLRDVGMRQELAGYLGVLQLTAELYDDTMEAWGGGRYRGRVFQGNDYKTSIQFQIAGEAKARNAPSYTGEALPPSKLETLVQQLAETQAKLLEALRPTAPQVSSLDQALAIVKAMREVATQPPAPAQDPLQLFTLFDKMLELRARVAEETDDRQPDNGVGAILRDGVQPLIALVREKMDLDKQREARAARGRQLSAGPPLDPVSALAARIPAMGRAFLTAMARAGKQPELYAEMILDQLPDGDYETLPSLIAQADFIPRLLVAVPEWEPYPDWFRELSSEMHASIERAAVEGVVEGAEVQEGPAPETPSSELQAAS